GAEKPALPVVERPRRQEYDRCQERRELEQLAGCPEIQAAHRDYSAFRTPGGRRRHGRSRAHGGPHRDRTRTGGPEFPGIIGRALDPRRRMPAGAGGGAPGGTRTPTSLRTADFESAASTVPPLGPRAGREAGAS